MSFRLSAYLVATLLCAALVAAHAAGPVYPPGLRVGMEPPGDLKPSATFPGFADPERKVAVNILDLPAAAYAELNRAIQSKKQQGLVDVRRETFSFNSGSGTLLTARGEIDKLKVHKWVLLATAADQDLTVLINVEMPDSALAVYSDAVVRKALASVTFRPMPIQEQLGLLPFKLDDLAGFRVTKVLAAGGVILTDGPGDDLAKQPYMIISIGPGAHERPDDRANFARDLLLTAPLHDLSLQSGEAMRIDGLPGYEIRAQAKGPEGEPLAVVQWIRYSGAGFTRVIGVTRKDDWDALFNRFRAVRDGIQPADRR